MTSHPTGTVTSTPAGFDLVITRTFRAPIEDVWASVTEPERTARWFGAWRGDAGPGKVIDYQMVFEEGGPWEQLRIEACEPPYHLDVTLLDPQAGWHLELRLSESAGVTELQLVQHLADTTMVHDVGPGWEYYLDMLVASREGLPLPTWGDDYLAQSEHFVAAAEAATRGSRTVVGNTP